MALRHRVVLLGLAVCVLGIALAAPAAAVPVFSRKYHTSCSTCHAIFPKLNPYGEAFRLNGYHMPDEADSEDLVKEKPVSLGAPAYERIWPAQVWLSDLPSSTPIAINVKMANIYASSHDTTGHAVVHNDFQFPQEANLFTAGTLGKSFSFLGEITYAENPDNSSSVEIERVHLEWSSAFGSPHLINFKVGKFAPDFADGFQEMWLMTNNGVDSLFSYDPIGLHGGSGLSEEPLGISLPGNVKGIEMFGVAHHRVFYTVGIANGIGPSADGNHDGNSTKDVYARVDYKLGGLGLDGDATGLTLPAENWRETSVRFGAFGYRGSGTNIPFALNDDAGNPFAVEDRRYERVGVVVSAYLDDLNVFGVFVHGKDHLRVTDLTAETLQELAPDYDAFFVQADYVIKPPFQVSLRYERLRPGDRAAAPIRSLNANLSFLARANVKAMLEYHRDLADSQNYELATVLRFAF